MKRPNSQRWPPPTLSAHPESPGREGANVLSPPECGTLVLRGHSKSKFWEDWIKFHVQSLSKWWLSICSVQGPVLGLDLHLWLTQRCILHSWCLQSGRRRGYQVPTRPVCCRRSPGCQEGEEQGFTVGVRAEKALQSQRIASEGVNDVTSEKDEMWLKHREGVTVRRPLKHPSPSLLYTHSQAHKHTHAYTWTLHTTHLTHITHTYPQTYIQTTHTPYTIQTPHTYTPHRTYTMRIYIWYYHITHIMYHKHYTHHMYTTYTPHTPHILPHILHTVHISHHTHTTHTLHTMHTPHHTHTHTTRAPRTMLTPHFVSIQTS